MKTKAVYVVVSSMQDVYFEQAWVSAWSLKHYNPDMRVECVVDQDTYENIINGYRKNAMDVIDELIKVEVPEEYDNKVRSRWLKTSLRKHVKGDYIFLDCDTIVSDKLDSLESLDGQVMMVLDSHLPLSLKQDCSLIQKKVKKISGREITSDKYYNSGVMFVRDSEVTHRFYETWHHLWNVSLQQGMVTDQPALAATQFEYDLVEKFDDVFHCQIKNTVKYLASAKIVHFFCLGQKENSPNPFYNEEIYRQIRPNGGIADELKKKILDCKSQFVSPSCIISGEEVMLKNTISYVFLAYMLKNHPFLFQVTNRVSSVCLKLLKKLSNKKNS